MQAPVTTPQALARACTFPLPVPFPLPFPFPLQRPRLAACDEQQRRPGEERAGEHSAHPGKSGERRTAHFPELRTPALFVHGSADPFGTLDEVEAARALIPARTQLLPLDGAGHDLFRMRAPALAETIAAAFLDFTAKLGKAAMR